MPTGINNSLLMILTGSARHGEIRNRFESANDIKKQSRLSRRLAPSLRRLRNCKMLALPEIVRGDGGGVAQAQFLEVAGFQGDDSAGALQDSFYQQIGRSVADLAALFV